MTTGFGPTSDMWLNDPQVCRDADPDWDAKIEAQNFDADMRAGKSPAQAYKNPETQRRYARFLYLNGSTPAQ